MNLFEKRWNQLQSFLDHHNSVNVMTNGTATESVHISVKSHWGAEVETLPVRELNSFCTFLSENATPSLGFLQYLNTALSPMKHTEPNAMNKLTTYTLSKTLSSKMNGLNLNVNIPNSLTRMLLTTINASNSAISRNLIDTVSFGENHLLSVVVQIPELDPRHVKGNCDLLQLVPAAQYHMYNQGTGQFAAKLNFSEAIFEGIVNDAQALVALVIVLKYYPQQWRQNFFWDAWLAVTIQLCLSAKFEPGKVTFPCLWMRQAFDAERLVIPENVNHLLFGKDPVSNTGTYDLSMLCKADGIAFHAVGNDNPSIEGMRTCYGLDCNDDNPEEYVKNGLLMVNLIRCIGENDESLSKNSCRDAWIAYSLKIIHHFSSINKPIIVLTEASSVLPGIYIPAVCNGDIVKVPHPSAPIQRASDHQQSIDVVSEHLSDYNPYRHRKSHQIPHFDSLVTPYNTSYHSGSSRPSRAEPSWLPLFSCQKSSQHVQLDTDQKFHDDTPYCLEDQEEYSQGYRLWDVNREAYSQELLDYGHRHQFGYNQLHFRSHRRRYPYQYPPGHVRPSMPIQHPWLNYRARFT